MVGVGHMLLGEIQAHDRKKVYIHHQYDSVMRIGEKLGDCWRLLNYLFFFFLTGGNPISINDINGNTSFKSISESKNCS
jgi:hypothetical protein